MIMTQTHEKNIRKKQIFKIVTLIIISLAIISVLFFLDPIKQNPNYHLFADKRKLFSIPNFWNVISNLPFIIAGLAGIRLTIRTKHKAPEYQAIRSYLLFFVGIFFIGIGSCYYHLNPTNHTLFWDRLPMSISFMAFFSIIITEFISIKLGTRLLFPLIVLGMSSLIYWQITEHNGCGDLRLYGLIQFLPMILISIILLFFENSFSDKKHFIQILVVYVIAKVFESLDYFVFNSGILLSGHTIKHFVSATAPLLMINILYKRTRLPNHKNKLPQIN
jgi:cytochrome bd-type quinol oxidase subunit 2